MYVVKYRANKGIVVVVCFVVVVKYGDFAEAYCFIIFNRSLRTWQRHLS